MPTLLAVAPGLLGPRGLAGPLLCFGAVALVLLALACGIALLVPTSRWSRRTERVTQATLWLMLAFGTLNLLMSLPMLIGFASPETAPRLVSVACNNLVLYCLWRDSMSVAGAGLSRNCPWRFTVFASLSVLVPALASLSQPNATWFNVAVGQMGTVLQGFNGWLWWNGVAAVSAAVTIACAAMHRAAAVWAATWMALWCVILAPVIYLALQHGVMLPGKHATSLTPAATLSYTAAPLFLAALFGWLALELRSRVQPV